ncbi:glycosyltransferase family 4 protein [Candidatus Sumerlaeota bacterium]|nr:glycosyltransferase family 4 protein [Candidatus Sumerlaeota bacterium]
MRPIVWIIPWFHEEVGGGSEVKVREYARRLVARGHDVEVWTTRCRDFHDNWNVDHWPEGLGEVCGIPTRRFPVRPGNHTVFNGLNARALAGDRLTPAEELAFFRESINSEALMDHVRANGAGRHLIFTPYLYGTTFHGARILPEHSLLYPEFHNEPYAHFEALRGVVEGVRGILYHSHPERELANRLFDIAGTPQEVTGLGVESPPPGDPERFRAKHGLGDTPFLLCAGRQSRAKNVGLLCDFFMEWRRLEPGRPLKLVLIGKPDMPIPDHPDILPLGFVSAEDKIDAHRAATALCQPSVNESFSIVMMESWLCGVPVLVNGWCAVTRHHCEITGGGLWFETLWDFREAVNWLLDHPRGRVRMAHQGRDHVLRECDWDAVMGRFEGFLERLESGEGCAP